MADTLVRGLTDRERCSTTWVVPLYGATLEDRQRRPRWEAQTAERLRRLMELPPGWDSYGASPVDGSIVGYTQQILSRVMDEATPLPQIVPTSTGGIQLEWHQQGIDLEVEVTGPYRCRVSFEDFRCGECWEKEFKMYLTPLVAIVRRLDRPPY